MLRWFMLAGMVGCAASTVSTPDVVPDAGGGTTADASSDSLAPVNDAAVTPEAEPPAEEQDAGSGLGRACSLSGNDCPASFFVPGHISAPAWCFNKPGAEMFERCTFACSRSVSNPKPGQPVVEPDPEKKRLCEALGGVCVPPASDMAHVCVIR